MRVIRFFARFFFFKNFNPYFLVNGYAVSAKHSLLILTHFYAILVFAFFILSVANDQRQKIHSTYGVPELANVLMTLCIYPLRKRVGKMGVLLLQKLRRSGLAVRIVMWDIFWDIL